MPSLTLAREVRVAKVRMWRWMIPMAAGMEKAGGRGAGGVLRPPVVVDGGGAGGEVWVGAVQPSLLQAALAAPLSLALLAPLAPALQRARPSQSTAPRLTLKEGQAAWVAWAMARILLALPQV